MCGHGKGAEKLTGLKKNLLSYIWDSMKEKYPITLAKDWTNEDVEWPSFRKPLMMQGWT